MHRTALTASVLTLAVTATGCAGTQDTAGDTTPAAPAAAAAEVPVEAQPDGYFSLTPALVVDDVAAALEFYQAALGAEIKMVMKTPDQSMILHAEIQLGDSVVMIGPASEMTGGKSPLTLGGSPASLTYYVEDVDAAVAKAVSLGATVAMPVADQFWGDRYGLLVDPFGHRWGLATHKEELTDAQIGERAQAMAAAGGAPVSFEPGTPAASWRPEGYHSLTPGIVVRNAAAVIDFYVRAFGAVERTRMAMPDGRLMHAEVQIGDSVVMLSDEMPEFGATSPLSLGGTPFGMMLYVDDVDATFAGAVEAGAEAKQPVQDMFWGDRYGMVKDPSGHEWGLATHTRDLTPEQMAEEMKKQFAAPAGE